MNVMLLGAAASLSIGGAAVAEFELTFSASELPAGFVRTAASPYAGRAIIAVGYRDLVVDNLVAGLGTTNDFQAGWGMTLPAYGTSFFTLAAPIGMTYGENTIGSVGYDVTGYGAVVAADNTWFGSENIGAGIFGADYNGVSGEFFFVIEGEEVPAPGAIALLGLAGLASRRRRA